MVEMLKVSLMVKQMLTTLKNVSSIPNPIPLREGSGLAIKPSFILPFNSIILFVTDVTTFHSGRVPSGGGKNPSLAYPLLWRDKSDCGGWIRRAESDPLRNIFKGKDARMNPDPSESKAEANKKAHKINFLLKYEYSL